ncbi:MAG TPA: hypothetical protein VFU22_28085 [Roseiflexaceae bacterium]|nr:hypothetical protein [Roseiflexaceae bacterium]
MMLPAIDIDIDALVLRNLRAFDADAFGAALSGELARLLSAGAPDAGAWRVEAVHVELAGALDSAPLGVQVAQAVYAQLVGGGP